MGLNQLTVEEVEHIFKKIYDNACELLNDAEILFNNKRYSRAYFCSHIAYEEFGKLPMLNSAALDIFYGEKVDWKNLNKRFRSHKKKINQSFITSMSVLVEFYKTKGQSHITIQSVADNPSKLVLPLISVPLQINN